MTERTVKAKDIEGRDAVDLLREVVRRKERLTVILSGEEAVSIGPALALEPLPELAGYVPKGWKDATYER